MIKATKIDLRDIRQLLAALKPTLIPSELIDATGSIDLDLTVNISPTQTYKGAFYP